ncbi:MAG: hypothetical protein J6Z08_08320 [Elusimicrobiales bacterium]|nr:hypothetical protein [Elusimicrobiales bacterium]
MIAEESEYKGSPVLIIKRNENDKYPVSFGLSKARLILDSIDEIRKFVQRHDMSENTSEDFNMPEPNEDSLNDETPVYSYAKQFNVNALDYIGFTIDSLNLSTRSYNCLKLKQCYYISDLLCLSYNSLLKIRNLGEKSAREIQKKLQKFLSKHKTDVVIKNKQYSDVQKISEIDDKLGYFFAQIPENIKQKSAIRFIKAYDSSQKAHLENQLLNFEIEDKSIENLFYIIQDDTNNNIKRICYSFFNWICFDADSIVNETLENIFTDLKQNNKDYEILLARATGKTLQEIGDSLKISRERARQLENRASKFFWEKYNVQRYDIIMICYALYGKSKFKANDIKIENKEYKTIFTYCLDRMPYNKNYRFIKGLNIFEIKEEGEATITNISELINKKIKDMPKILLLEDFHAQIKNISSEFKLPVDIVLEQAQKQYKPQGKFYHKSKITLAKIYDYILRKYYPNGIHIYDDKEIEILRQHVYKEYGNITLPGKNYNIASGISLYSVLAGKGIYRPKKDKYISKDLAKKILSYILHSNTPIMLVSSVFNIFENELISEGIDNRYYLQGVLHELFGSELYFKRDYVSKDKRFTSIHSEIVSFIKKSKYPVTKDEIKSHFKGITDIVILLAIGDSNILNYFGEYMHGSNLKISEAEKKYLDYELSNILKDGKPHHIKNIFPVFYNERPEIFSRNAAMESYRAFSMLEYLFQHKYQFSRPYIALNDVKIGCSKERLHDMIYCREQLPISDITEFAKENHMFIQSIIEYINSLNDKYLLLNRDFLISIDSLNINVNVAKEVEQLIRKEISGTVPIRNLQCISELPNINAAWDEWLIYSVLKKWSKELDVALSSSQLKHSIPLVALFGKMDISDYLA